MTASLLKHKKLMLDVRLPRAVLIKTQISSSECQFSGHALKSVVYHMLLV